MLISDSVSEDVGLEGFFRIERSEELDEAEADGLGGESLDVEPFAQSVEMEVDSSAGVAFLGSASSLAAGGASTRSSGFASAGASGGLEASADLGSGIS